MARSLVLALLCAAVAVAAARGLSQPSVSELPKQLQELNARLAALAGKQETKKVSAAAAGFLEGVEYTEYEEPKYKEYRPKYTEPKYEEKEEKEEKYDYKEDYGKKDYGYGYGKDKVSVKLYEKFRSHLRPQPGNVNTFQFTSELTCQNPKVEHGPEHEDGFIGFPIVSDRMKLVTVGVCEWTVTQVKEQRISEHAKLKGNTNVVCTFTEEAERHCKNGGDIMEEGLTVSGQGLVYNFDNNQYGYYKEAKTAADGKDAEEGEGVDVYLNLINGVINRQKEMKFDNGALQFFFGVPPASFDKGRDATFMGDSKKGDPTGEYTFVFKH